jgi:hypothetical protein
MGRCIPATERIVAIPYFNDTRRQVRTFAGPGFTLDARSRPLKERGVAYPRPGGEPLYKMTALSVASRRLPGTSQRNVLPSASILLWDTTAHRTAAPRDVPGSRLLLTHRAAKLQSGSPPGAAPLNTRRVCNPSVFSSSPFTRTGVSESLVLESGGSYDVCCHLV